MSSSIPLFVNGEGMRGGAVHHTIAEHPFIGYVHTAPKYRFFSVGDRFPALWPVEKGGVSVPGELYRVPLTTIRDQFIPAEPPELELSVIELADGESALAVVLRGKILGAADLVDISIGAAGVPIDSNGGRRRVSLGSVFRSVAGATWRRGQRSWRASARAVRRTGWPARPTRPGSPRVPREPSRPRARSRHGRRSSSTSAPAG